VSQIENLAGYSVVSFLFRFGFECLCGVKHWFTEGCWNGSLFDETFVERETIFD